MQRIFGIAALAIVTSAPFGIAQEAQPEAKPEVQTLILQLKSNVSNEAKPQAEAKPQTEAKPGTEAKPALVQRTPAVEIRGGGVGAGGSGGLVLNAFGGGKSAADWYIESTDKIAKLSDEQKGKIKEVFAAREQAMKEFQASIEAKAKAAGAAMTEAFKSQNKEEIAKAQKAYQETYAPMHDIMKKSDAALQALLTAEQKSKIQDNQLAVTLSSWVPGVRLNEDQRKKIKEGLGEGGWGREGIGSKFPELINKTLTAEQITAVLKHRANSYVKMIAANVKLSDEQKKKADDKVAELLKDHKPTVMLDPSAYGKIQEAINGLLTVEQKEAVKKQNPWIANAGGGLAGGGAQSPQRSSTQPAANPANSPQLNPAPKAVAETKPGEKVEIKRYELKLGERQPEGKPGVKVQQLPGGGVQVIIAEGAENKEGKRLNPGQSEKPSAEQIQLRLENLTRELTKAAVQQANPKNAMRERVKRQLELTKKASKLMKKIDELGDGNSSKARDLWEDLEHVQGKLQQTMGGRQNAVFNPYQPQQSGQIQLWQPMPGQPIVSQWQVVPGQPAPGQPAQGGFAPATRPLATQPAGSPAPGASPTQPQIQLIRKPEAPGAAQKPQGAPPGAPLGAPNPGAGSPQVLSTYAIGVPAASNADVLKELQTLKRQVEELKGAIQKLKQDK